MLEGPKGAGKTSIAERIPTILPDLTGSESLELTAIHSLAGVLEPGAGMVVRPPFSAPHHDASKASLIGGGSGAVRPGELSRTHLGVLFLDEFPLFHSDVIDALRQPLESGDVTVARREESVTLPARAMVVLACNPCPCGEYAPRSGSMSCGCTERKRRDYRARITGPIADRIDVVRYVEPLAPHDQRDVFSRAEPSEVVRRRVSLARRRQADRYAGCSWRLNAHTPGPQLRDRWRLDADAQRMVDEQVYAGQLTGRGAVRVNRLAWTVLDLLPDERARPGLDEVEVALRLRRGEPLLSSTLRRAG